MTAGDHTEAEGQAFRAPLRSRPAAYAVSVEVGRVRRECTGAALPQGARQRTRALF
jgi:hypothetical protein